ncbi:DUF4328 domain-containing protein [Microbulbifer discodermiae]|uniref:DUF4328 domain-containing protein n=1 Tax=Microbulbifer sp. 2201CG32-9 TaxID=3232309 RepID=UPI00345BC15A
MSDTENNYKDSSSLTSWVRYMLYAQIAVIIISLWSNFLEYQLLSDYQNGVYISQEEAVADGEASDQRQQVIALFYLVVFIVSGFVILRWIYRANYNARQLGARDMEFTPGWSIGYYFIPILTLWKPFQAMNEIWKASHNPSDWSTQKAGSILGLWWFLWIVTNALGQATFRISMRAEELQELINVNIITQISDALSILLALVTLSIVNSIYQAQYATYKSASQ